MSAKSTPIAVAIFSYNRGNFLLNALRSVWEMMPRDTPVYVFDDGSTEVRTQAVLELAASLGCSVNSSGHRPTGGRGGLLGMMQDALGMVEEDHVLLLQDDMQVVRPIDRAELGGLGRFLERSPHPILWTSFLRELDLSRRSGDSIALDHSANFGDDNHFYIQNSSGEIRSYSHTGLYNFRLLRSRTPVWSFESEPFKLAHWRKEFGHMPVWRNPFSALLPWSESWRKRGKTVAHIMWESIYAGFNPLVPMSNAAQVRLKTRNHFADPPYYGEYLLSFSSKIRKPWRFSGFSDAPRWVRAMSVAEDFVLRYRRNR